MTKRVAVIGAGPSGLVTVKELLDEGHQPTCFERAAGPGGVFRFAECDGVVWDSCRLTSSGLISAFSDFPVPPDRAEHMLTGEYADYIARYSEAFGLTRHLRFGITVESVRQSPSGGWLVGTIDQNGLRREDVFDSVAICSGLNQHPNLPSCPGQEIFTGTIIHGSRYRRPDQLRGKRVLIVGGGESGGDIAAEVSRSAAETVLSLRRGVAVLPRQRHGLPNDYRTCRIANSSAHWVFQTRNPADNWKQRVYLTVFFPLVMVDKLVQSFSTLAYEVLPLFHPRYLLAGRDGIAEAKTGLRMRKLTRRLLQESGGTVAEQFGTKGEDFVRAMAQGQCRRVGPIARFEGSRVHFEGGGWFEPDAVIFCTGFEPRMPFLDEALSRPPRFLHAFNPAVGPSLGFIGFVRPAHGAIPPVAELQGRYFALLQSGRLELPAIDEMRRSIDQLMGLRRHLFRAVRGRLDHLVDYTSFCDELAARIGCKPSWAVVRRESFGFRWRFFAAPFVAAQYRLVGPHAQPEMARAVIGSLPVSHPLPMLMLYYLRWRLSRLLHRALGTEFSPKLSLQAR